MFVKYYLQVLSLSQFLRNAIVENMSMTSNRLFSILSLIGGVFIAVGASHCGSSSGAADDDPVDEPDEKVDAGKNDDEPPSPNPGDGTFGDDAGPADPVGEVVKEVFGHSPHTLYKLEPVTKAITVIGNFEGCGNGPMSDGVIDIAIDADSNIYGDTYTGLYKIDKATAKCTSITNSIGGARFPDSLSFVPKGTLDANEEALVGYTGSDYVRIDVKTGAITKVGALGAGGLISSGDIVSIKDGPTYLTVKPPPFCFDAECGKCTSGDCIVEVDPKTGKMIKNYGAIPYKDVFGFAFWGGLGYGFDNSGHLFEVSFADPSKLVATELTIPSKPNNLQFWGAASSTTSPVKPPVN